MAFVITQSDAYFWPVTIEIPIDGGRYEKHTFDAQFKRLTQSRIEGLTDNVFAQNIKDRDVLAEVMTGWKGVNDNNGDEFIWSEKNRDIMLDIPMVAATIVKAWLASLSGARQKN